MRASLKNSTTIGRRRISETDEGGFSLIELIVVVVILGILAAIAVPVFTGLQRQAEVSAIETIASNAATQVAADFALGKTQDEIEAGLVIIERESDLAITMVGGSADNFCLTADRGTGAERIRSRFGPACTGLVHP